MGKEKTIQLRSEPLINRPVMSSLTLAAASLAGGALAFFALVARLSAFWFLTRWSRVLLLAVGAVLCGFLFGWILKIAWARLAAPPRGIKLAWLGMSICAGILVWRALPAPAAMPLLYTLELETRLAAQQQVTLFEVRDSQNNIVPVENLQLEGQWERVRDGLAASGSQPSRLRYSFYAPSQGKLKLLFADNPSSGEVVMRLNGQEKTINLARVDTGTRLVEFPFQKQSRWDKILLLANLGLFGLVLPLALFVTPFLALRLPRLAPSRQQAAAGFRWLRQSYDVVFVGAVLVLLLLPLQGFQGSWDAFNARFWGYPQLWQAYSDFRLNILRDTIFDQVIVSGNGWLLFTSEHSMDDYQKTGSFSDEELFQIQRRIDASTDYLAQQGITFLVVVTPNKTTVYPETIPAQISVIGAQSRLEQLLAYEKSHGKAKILDTTPALLAARKDHELFYPTDSHWNDYGAQAASSAILDRLHNDIPALAPHSLADYQYRPGDMVLGDLGAKFVPGAAKDQFFSLAPKFPYKISRFELTKDKALNSFRYNNTDQAQQLPSLVMYHDSFGSALSPLLADSFSKSVFIWSKEMRIDYLESEKPDVVIFQTTERLMDELMLIPVPAEKPGQ